MTFDFSTAQFDYLWNLTETDPDSCKITVGDGGRVRITRFDTGEVVSRDGTLKPSTAG